MDIKESFVASNEVRTLKQLAAQIRKRIIEIIFQAKSGHTGGSLSATDMLVVLFFHVMHYHPEQPDWPDRDRFILSKGHSVESLYCTLAKAGFMEDALLDTYGSFGTPLVGHPTRKIPGIEVNSGALGHGLSFGVGLALAAQLDRRAYRTFVLMGDGEQGEGSVYEAAMAASHYHLSNLIALIDRNGLQISGKTEQVMSLEPLRDRWEQFGWEVEEVDGHDIEAMINLFDRLLATPSSKPHLIISHTVKGKGVSFMENVAGWHHGVPSEAQYRQAIQEIEATLAALNGEIAAGQTSRS